MIIKFNHKEGLLWRCKILQFRFCQFVHVLLQLLSHACLIINAFIEGTIKYDVDFNFNDFRWAFVVSQNVHLQINLPAILIKEECFVLYDLFTW